MLELLEKQGDAHEIERDVSHWAHFERENDRDSFKLEIFRLGYSINGEHFTHEVKKYCLSFKKKQAVTPNEIDESVVELFQMAKRHHGEYDGWETQVKWCRRRQIKFSEARISGKPTVARSAILLVFMLRLAASVVAEV